MPATILLKNGTVLGHDSSDTHVIVHRNTDILIEGNKIARIGPNITLSTDESSTTTFDCTGKIISPGFIDTHRHLWQTQLKGRHVDETLLDYFTSGNMQHNNYTAEDIYWGQLAGAMECINVGTTFVLDHAHCCSDEDKTKQALSGTVTSGVRSVFAYMKPMQMFKEWNEKEIIPEGEGIDLALDPLDKLVEEHPYGDGRVSIGFSFDGLFLPEAMVKDAFARAVKAGVKVITTHIVNIVTSASRAGQPSSLTALLNYDLHKTTPHLVLSHCTNLPPQELDALAKTQIAISATPETEAQMAHGDPVLFHPGLNVSLGVDCHTNNTSFIPQIARTGLFCARLTTNHEVLAKSKFPKTLRGSTERLLNAMTVQGAKAVGMLDQIGSLREGKLADLVVFDAPGSLGMSCVCETDPLAAVVRFSDVRDVEMVIVDGVVRKKEGKMCAVTREGQGEMGWDVVREKLVQSTRDIWARDEKCNHDIAWGMVKGMMGVAPDGLVDID